MPSNPNPKYSESAVATTAASSKIFWLRIQSLLLVEPAGGPATVQPPSPSSNEVASVVAPRVTVTSSRSRPGDGRVAQSVMYVIETSTCLPAYGVRSTFHCCQPPELPVAAFQVPVVPPA